MQPPKQDFSDTLHNVDKDEKLLAIIKRHPFGIIRLYAAILIGLGASVGLVFYLLPAFVKPDENSGIYAIVGVIAVIVVGFMLFIAAIATTIYNKSQLLITDKTITQTIQVSLFNKKVSQLAVSSVEDVTANTNGIFPTLFGYGKLLIETAGEQENFHFEYCPHADHYAKLVLEARQQFLGEREMELRQSGQNYANTMQAQQVGSQPITQNSQPIGQTSQPQDPIDGIMPPSSPTA